MSTKSLYVAAEGFLSKDFPMLTQKVGEAMSQLDGEGYQIVGVAPVAGAHGVTAGIIVAGQRTEK